MTDLITLTASDLDGCRGGMMCQTGFGAAVFHGVTTDGISVWLVDQARLFTTYKRIQCRPHDYIRAWLGPRGEMFDYAEKAHVWDGKVILSRSTTYQYDDVIVLVCPPALASAMGDSVWVRGENGWEVRK